LPAGRRGVDRERMHPGPRATVLAAYNSRSRVTRGDDGVIRLFWGMMSVAMNGTEFLDFAGLVAEAAGREMRCGELARGSYGRVVRCSMGQIKLSHDNLTLWFSPGEFEEFCRLVAGARRRLADCAPAPRLGMPWGPREEGFFGRN
jgi:hypothetical protein